jgi:hypothetical protein
MLGMPPPDEDRIGARPTTFVEFIASVDGPTIDDVQDRTTAALDALRGRERGTSPHQPRPVFTSSHAGVRSSLSVDAGEPETRAQESEGACAAGEQP